MRFTIGQVVDATRGRILSGEVACVPTGVSIDSRTLAPGELFFAIVGPRHDGHAHVREAVDRGASGVIVSDADVGLSAGVVAVLVEDTTRALQDLAAAVRKASAVEVVAVTGSVGKTTTKELIRLLVAGDRTVHASPGNLNNHYGLPLALLAMPEGCAACVLEMGISTPGEMDRLIEVASPDHGLVTLIAPAHVGNFSSLAELADEKMKLPRASRQALLNADDPEQWRRRHDVPGTIVPFGTAADAGRGVRLVQVADAGLGGSVLTLEADGRCFEVPCPLPGAHQARNMLAAVTAALAIGIDADVVAAQAASAQAGPHRGEVLDVAGVTVVDDTYNANPRAMCAALELLGSLPAAGRRVFVAGDMLELGERSASEHEAVGQKAASHGVDVLVGVGEEASRAVSAAREAGVDAVALPDAAAAAEWLARELRRGDVVLLKGSRGVALERAVEGLREGRGAA